MKDLKSMHTLRVDHGFRPATMTDFFVIDAFLECDIDLTFKDCKVYHKDSGNYIAMLKVDDSDSTELSVSDVMEVLEDVEREATKVR